MPGLELRTGPRWLYGAPGVITISLGFLFLCCVVLIAPAVVLVCQIGGELWNLMLNNHNYGICRQGQYHVDKGGGGGGEKRLRQGRWPGTSYMTSGLKSITILSISPADLFISSQHRHHYINTVPAASEISGKYFPCGTPHFSPQIQFHPFNCFFLLIIGWEGDLISKAILISLISDGGW